MTDPLPTLGYLVRTPDAPHTRLCLEQAQAHAQELASHGGDVVIWAAVLVIPGKQVKAEPLPSAGLVGQARRVLEGVQG